ncbi:MAG: bis(5'-nucleosyl)-tetraphosphatase (symmetrical) YqeK [Clostridiales Family XIII bacterium]|jgi:ribosome silencing factor RsfS/YbeB/iojap|nr:bis(5'-nucleosyl)-tetraphosphatase (symmetrical) YqeK [Clostridiales Family XIII bacterium]
MDIKRIEEIVRARENPRRFEHTMNVMGMAVRLARLYGVDESRARIAALFHDLCKDCEKPGNDLSHAGEAADLMQSEYGIGDEDVLNAVRYHTTGRAGMSKLELVVFLADTLEPTRSYEGVTRLRGLVHANLYRGALEVIRELNVYLVKSGIEPAQDSLDAIEWLEGEIRNMPTESNSTENGKIMDRLIQGYTGVAGAVSAGTEESVALARAIADAIDAKKGLDITILDISGQSSFADCFVNATATNTRMLSTLRDEVGDVLEGRGLAAKGAEGREGSGWILVDCGDVIVNLFLAEQREKYQLEKIWGDAVKVL